ncbi:MAG: histidine phosphatase family protein [Tissierella sp.]|nr:histidine phosphatase family protein [Tissierella sp.]
MKIYLTRHGQTEWNVIGRLQGWNNSNLTEEGIGRAKSLSNRLKDVDFDFIYSSPQQRALDTANIIRGDRDIEIQILDDLREIGFGTWEGMEIKDIQELYTDEYDTYLNRPHLYEPLDGESLLDVYKRAENALNKILSTKAENILVVSHGVTIKILTSIIKGVPLEELYQIPVQVGTALNICEYGDDKLRFIVEEDTSHII